eukprot:3854558-Rhodomonas_salina.1
MIATSLHSKQAQSTSSSTCSGSKLENVTDSPLRSSGTERSARGSHSHTPGHPFVQEYLNCHSRNGLSVSQSEQIESRDTKKAERRAMSTLAHSMKARLKKLRKKGTTGNVRNKRGKWSKVRT